jgi:hypothetical protein
MMDDFKVSGFETNLPPGSIAERVVPLPTYLASSACTVNGEAFSSGAGRYARVFVGVTEGWLAPGGTIATAEDIASHLDQIEDRSEFLVPTSIYDELKHIGQRVADRDGVPYGTPVKD